MNRNAIPYFNRQTSIINTFQIICLSVQSIKVRLTLFIVSYVELEFSHFTIERLGEEKGEAVCHEEAFSGWNNPVAIDGYQMVFYHAFERSIDLKSGESIF